MMTDEAKALAVAPENKRKRHGESERPHSSGRNLSMALLSVKQEGEEKSRPRASGLYVEDDDPKAMAVPVLGPMLNKVPLSPEAVSADIKYQLRKEIRQFGRKYERIFQLLKGIQGPAQVRRLFVEFTIKEAARFKRRDLIQHLEKELDKIDSDHFLKKDHSTPKA